MANTKKESGEKQATTKLEDEFKELPLDEKLASLFKMEVVALNEAVTMVINNPGRALEKVGEVITDWGKRLEVEIRNAVRSNGDTNAAGSPPVAEKEPKAKGTE